MKATPATKKFLLTLLLGAIVSLSISSSSAWAKNSYRSGSTTISDAEAAMLTFMREEEKLARDVYLKMYEIWGAVIFKNISNSEQQHIGAMKRLLEKYALPDPAPSDVGLFTNKDLQRIYDELIDEGSASFTEALYVGATIEELDMVDLQKAIDTNSQIEMVFAYKNLLKASQNHLKAYVGLLAAQGYSYTPQLMSPTLFRVVTTY